MSKEYPSYNVYKGLQKPLIFKGFNGKFIYIGGACIISALLLCAIVSTLASFMWGGITLAIVMIGGLPVKKYTVPLCSMSSSSVIQRLFQQRRVGSQQT